MNLKEFLGMSEELVRMKEMDYYRYHSYLNSLESLFKEYQEIENEELREAILAFVRTSIQKFTEVYGGKKYPEDLRKKAQKLIINKAWYFN